ncbi:MAG: hypothetical protein ABWZ75_06730 [Novosphingobium sp.]
MDIEPMMSMDRKLVKPISSHQAGVNRMGNVSNPHTPGKRRAPDVGKGVVNPFAVTMAISSIGSILGLETAIGISGGHAETRALIEWCIDQLEP